MLAWLTDRYNVVAGDIAGTFASRGYSTITNAWENLPAAGLTERSGIPVKYVARAVYITVAKGTGGYRNGVRIFVAVHADPMHNFYVVPLIDAVQGPLRYWEGRQELGAGIIWRVAFGGLALNDEVWMTVLYEKGGG